MVDRSTVLKLEEIDERAGVDESVFYRKIQPESCYDASAKVFYSIKTILFALSVLLIWHWSFCKKDTTVTLFVI